jgi:hypothetical protein
MGDNRGSSALDGAAIRGAVFSAISLVLFLRVPRD